jgi:hypothetical protein
MPKREVSLGMSRASAPPGLPRRTPPQYRIPNQTTRHRRRLDDDDGDDERVLRRRVVGIVYINVKNVMARMKFLVALP